MIDLIDALRDTIEPPSADDPEIADDGTHRDLTCAAPFEFEAETLYGYEELDERTLDETYAETATGVSFGVERQRFTIVFVYVAGGEGENSELRRSRAVSIALDARRDRYLRAVRENRRRVGEAVSVWDHIVGTADADYVRQLAVRGIAIRITGWRFVH